MIQVHNTMGRVAVDLVTRDEGKVGMYVCGPTVQSEPHVGHGRYAVAFDVIRRYLVWRGFTVTYVSNVTDVEDKIIQAAAEAGEPVEELAARMEKRFADSFRRLGVLEPDIRPRATEHIPEMIAITETLVEKEHAYVVDSGSVYFDVTSFPDYGKLSGNTLDNLREGHRDLESDPRKRHAADFALWKAAGPGRLMKWPSPWGDGFPGWHVECSAMSMKYLGDRFDIHATDAACATCHSSIDQIGFAFEMFDGMGAQRGAGGVLVRTDQDGGSAARGVGGLDHGARHRVIPGHDEAGRGHAGGARMGPVPGRQQGHRDPGEFPVALADEKRRLVPGADALEGGGGRSHPGNVPRNSSTAQSSSGLRNARASILGRQRW